MLRKTRNVHSHANLPFMEFMLEPSVRRWMLKCLLFWCSYCGKMWKPIYARYSVIMAGKFHNTNVTLQSMSIYEQNVDLIKVSYINAAGRRGICVRISHDWTYIFIADHGILYSIFNPKLCDLTQSPPPLHRLDYRLLNCTHWSDGEWVLKFK
jgi:hypothetical protein